MTGPQYDPNAPQFDPNAGAPGQPGYPPPGQPGYGQPPAGGFTQPLPADYGQQPDPAGYGQPSSPGYNQPPSQGYSQPPGPGYSQQPGPEYGQPSNPYVAPGYGTPNQMPSGSLAGVVRKRAMKQVAVGAAIFLVGLVITVATYSNASSSGGGTYFVAWGPMILGVIWVIRGLVAASKAGKLDR
jgi:hypothetical protein